MSRKLFLAVTTLAAIALGTGGGVSLARFSATAPPAPVTFEAARVSIVAWRGRGDRVPQPVQWTGWEAPMFYTTPQEGAYPAPPEGKYPTGLWAPGDEHERVLRVKNVDPDFVVRLEAIDAVLRGDIDLAPWFHVHVRDPLNQVIYQGTLADLATGPHPFVDTIGNHSFLVMHGYSEQQLFFTVTLDRDAPNDLQGKSLKADFRVYAGQHRNRP